MLTVPMKDHKGEILGVVQLINSKRSLADRMGSPEDVDEGRDPVQPGPEPLVLSLASQAAVSLENNNLYQDIETLFEGFVKASVQAIESRDPTTSGHSNRVAGLHRGPRAGRGPHRSGHVPRTCTSHGRAT